MEGMRIVKSKAIMAVLMLATTLFWSVSAAPVSIEVGGSTGWDLSSNMAEWSASTSFFVGDSLVFNYTPAHDVIEVSKDDFTECRTNSPIETYDSGETVILLTEPGSRYFICGKQNHCNLGLKLHAPVQYPPTSQANATDLNSSEPGNHRHQQPSAPQTSAGDREAHVYRCSRNAFLKTLGTYFFSAFVYKIILPGGLLMLVYLTLFMLELMWPAICECYNQQQLGAHFRKGLRYVSARIQVSAEKMQIIAAICLLFISIVMYFSYCNCLSILEK